MATREQLAIVLDSAHGWTAVPMMLTGCYDTTITCIILSERSKPPPRDTYPMYPALAVDSHCQHN